MIPLTTGNVSLTSSNTGFKNYFSFLAMHYAVEAVVVSDDESDPKASGIASKGAASESSIQQV